MAPARFSIRLLQGSIDMVDYHHGCVEVGDDVDLCPFIRISPTAPDRAVPVRRTWSSHRLTAFLVADFLNAIRPLRPTASNRGRVATAVAIPPERVSSSRLMDTRFPRTFSAAST
jgi:hypothetical protein